MSTSPHTLNLLETVGMQTQSLIQQLEEVFPPVNPTPDMTIEQIMYRSGQRHVVEWIQQQLEQE